MSEMAGEEDLEGEPKGTQNRFFFLYREYLNIQRIIA